MSTLRQAEAVMKIYKRKGKDCSFDEIYAWDGKGKHSRKASRIIGANYKSWYVAHTEGQRVDKRERSGG